MRRLLTIVDVALNHECGKNERESEREKETSALNWSNLHNVARIFKKEQ